MFELDECIAFITNNAAKKMADAFNERLMKVGISRVQWIALYFLGKYGSMSQIELSDKMNIKQSTVARLIDRMERDGFVKRVKDSNDRRIKNIILTEKGIEIREKLLPEGVEMSKIFSKGITDEEFEIFRKVINKMVSNIE